MGLLDGNLDPQSMATMQLAAGLLSPGSFGQGLGKGLEGYQGTMANAQTMQMRAQQLEAAKQAQLMQQLQFSRATNQYNMQLPIMQELTRRMSGKLGIGGTTSGKSDPSYGISQTSQGGNGAVDPTSTTGASGPSTGTSPVGDAYASSQQTKGGSTLFAGVPDDVAISTVGASGDMSRIPDLIAKYNEPTPDQKNNAAMGITPALAKLAWMAKASKDGEAERKPLSQFKNFFTNESGIVPKLPENANPVGNVAPNGALPGGVAPVPGALPIEQASAAAKEAGMQGEKVVNNVAGPNGPVSGRTNDVFGPSTPAPMRNNNPGALMPGGKLAQFGTPEAGMAALDANLKQYALKGVNTLSGVIGKWAPPNENNTAAYIADASKRLGIDPNAKIDLSNPVVRNAVATAITLHENGPAGVFGKPGVLTGPSNSDTAIQKSTADAIATAPQSVAQSRSAVTGLETALHQLESGVQTGPGTAQKVNALALLNNMGVPLMKGDVEGYQTLQKYLQNSLNAAAQGTGASGSDARFESFMHGQPNADTMNSPALQGAIRYVLSQHDAAIARGTLLLNAYQAAKAMNDPNAALSAQQKWSQTYQPDFFAFNRMNSAEQASYLKQKGGQASDFVKQYNAYAAKTGWVH